MLSEFGINYLEDSLHCLTTYINDNWSVSKNDVMMYFFHFLTFIKYFEISSKKHFCYKHYKSQFVLTFLIYDKDIVLNS